MRQEDQDHPRSMPPPRRPHGLGIVARGPQRPDVALPTPSPRLPNTRLRATALPQPSLTPAVHLSAVTRTDATIAAPSPHHHHWRAWLLFCFDAIMLNMAFLLAYLIRFDILRGVTFEGTSGFVHTDLSVLHIFQATWIVAVLLVLATRGMYRLRPTGAFFRQTSLYFTASTTCFALFSVYEFFFRATEYTLVENTRAIVVFTWLTTIVVPVIGRLILLAVVTLAYRLGIGRTRLLVVGSGRLGKLMMQHFAASPTLGYEVVGFVHERSESGEDFGRFRTLGTLDTLDRVLRDERIAEVIVALPSAQHEHIAHSISVCEKSGTEFRLIPDLHELSLARVDLATVDGIPTLSVRRLMASDWQRAIKRSIDVTLALAGLIAFAPLWLIIALIIRLDSPGKVIYRQKRVGLSGQLFTSYKFRSMHVDADARRADLAAENAAGRGLFKLKHDPRCTRFGRLLRRMSLDEVPQLWNVLRGEMSLVGPRPPLPEEVARYESWELRRLDVAPGLTGLWQIRGRSDITFDEMVLMDLSYIENWSLRLDIQILIKTLPVVLFSRGAY